MNDEFGDPPSLAFERPVLAIRGIVDGDTLDVELDSGWDGTLRERIRLEGLNTPEVRGVESAAGRYVTDQVREQLTKRGGDQMAIRSTAYSRTGKVEGRFGRTLATLWINNWCLNCWLLETGLAWPTDQRGKLLMPRDLRLLQGLPDKLRVIT